MREPPGAPRTFHHVLALHPRGRRAATTAAISWGAVAAFLAALGPASVTRLLQFRHDPVLGDQFVLLYGSVAIVLVTVSLPMAVAFGLRAARVMARPERRIEIDADALVIRDGSHVASRVGVHRIRSIRYRSAFPFRTTVRTADGSVSFDACWREPQETEFSLMLAPACDAGSVPPPPLPHLTLEAYALLHAVADASGRSPVPIPRRALLWNGLAVAVVLPLLAWLASVPILMGVQDVAGVDGPAEGFTCESAVRRIERWRPCLEPLALFHAADARVRLGCGQVEQALTAAQCAVLLDPTLHEARWILSRILTARGDVRGAWLAWMPARESSRESSREDNAAEDTRVLVLLDRAPWALRRLERLQPSSVRAQIAWAQAEVADGQPADALVRLFALPEPDWRVHVTRAAAWRCLGDEPAAGAELEAARRAVAGAPAAVADMAGSLTEHLAAGRSPENLPALPARLREEHRLLGAMLRCGEASQ